LDSEFIEEREYETHKSRKAQSFFTSKSGRLPDLSIKITPKAVIGIYENRNE
jgi:hypothetical protein